MKGLRCTGSGRNTWRFGNTAVSGTVGVGNLSLSALLAKLKSISVAMERWSVEHRAFAVETYLKKKDSVVTQRIFRRHFNFHWNECPLSQYFFLWGYLNSKVYEKKPRTTVHLKQNIREEVAAISPNMLQRVKQNFQKRLGECVDKGRHLTDTVFRKWML